jgi:hypothetical protein
MASHCCEEMGRQVASACDVHADRFDCPDAVVEYLPKFDEYGIIVHDGGASMIGIKFCPWCGKKLPASKRDEWFAELARRGVDPDSTQMPSDLQTDEWWRQNRASNPTGFRPAS